MTSAGKILRKDYASQVPLLRRFEAAMRSQLLELFGHRNLPLAVPLESRIKSIESIESKLTRRTLTAKSLADVLDLVGFRAVFLFKRDLDVASEMLRDALQVVSSEDTLGRLGEDTFGYQSLHLLTRIPEELRSIPVFRSCEGLCAEIQLRTLPQHLWAVASHTLQYKKEASVPLPLRRTMHRVSALLETVDLEFERLLAARDAYVVKDAKTNSELRLNVDLLCKMLVERLPKQNRKLGEEDYENVLEELAHFGIHTRAELTKLIDTYLAQALQEDRVAVRWSRRAKKSPLVSPERRDAGVYFTQCALVRIMLETKFGDAWQRFIVDRHKKRKLANSGLQQTWPSLRSGPRS